MHYNSRRKERRDFYNNFCVYEIRISILKDELKFEGLLVVGAEEMEVI